jgi:hypothetical protein
MKGDSMKRIILLISAVLFIFIIACGHNWKHSTIPESKWDEDLINCVNQAESEAGIDYDKTHPSLRSGNVGAVHYFVNKCMEEKGYYQGK